MELGALKTMKPHKVKFTLTRVTYSFKEKKGFFHWRQPILEVNELGRNGKTIKSLKKSLVERFIKNECQSSSHFDFIKVVLGRGMRTLVCQTSQEFQKSL